MTAGADIADRLSCPVSEIRGSITPGAPLSRITWFRVGGPAQWLYQPADTDDLSHFLSHLDAEVPVMVVGLGSNLLVRDGGIDGVVVRLSGRGFGSVAIEEGARVRVGAAARDVKLAETAAKAGIGGLEFYAGIPGAIGGALKMNAGDKETETCDRMVELVAVDRSGERVVLSNAEMNYRYRHSGAPEGLIFTEAVYQGVEASVEAALGKIAEVKRYREEHQPIAEKTGGSTFKNPPGHSAWKLVSDAGCRGLRVGGAQISEMHSNFMINTGEATATDLEILGERVRARVLAHSGIRLEWEIRRIGRWPDDVVIEEFAEN